MKTPRPIQLAEDYCNKRYGFNNHEYDAFLAGYDAAKAIIEAELASIEAQVPDDQIRAMEYVLGVVLTKMDDL